MGFNSDIIHLLGPEEIGQVDSFRKAKNTAVLAILFSDIEQSTSAAEQLGEQAFTTMRRLHDKLFVETMTRDNAGRIIKEIGDSFLCVFSEPSTAVERAVEFQMAISEHRDALSNEGYSLKVRIGIHLGQVAIENDIAIDIFGRHVNRASRIQSIASGGQVLTSKSVWENASGWVKQVGKTPVNSVYYGKAKLKGIPEPVEIYGFYPVDGEKPPVPPPIATSKKRRILTLALASSALLLAAWYIGTTLLTGDYQTNSHSTSEERKIWYVHFDFSGLKDRSDIDTVQWRSEMITLMSISLFPDSIVDDEDLRNHFSKRGLLYNPKYFSGNDSVSPTMDTEYYRDSLNFLHILEVRLRTMINRDSCVMELVRTDYEVSDQGDSISWGMQKLRPGRLSLISNDFRDFFNYFLHSEKSQIAHGTVMSSSDSQFVFLLSAQSKLRKGVMLELKRRYEGSKGKGIWLSDLKELMAFTKNTKELQSTYINAQNIYEDISRRNLDSTNYGWPMKVSAQVIEVYDSTGIARWRADKRWPTERPRPGDELYLQY